MNVSSTYKELTKKIRLSAILLFFAGLVLSSCADKPERVLIFSKTVEFRHSSIEPGTKAVVAMLESKQIQVDTTENAAYFTEDSLKRYSAVIFLNTSGDVLTHAQQADFERYIQAGGGFVGIHAATDTEYDWPWYNGLVGAYFNGHPAIQEATLQRVAHDDSCCTHLADTWTISEEWYNFKSIHPTIEVLMEIDEDSYEGGTHGGKAHPIVWKHAYDGGRSFYTALGHKEETYADPLFMQQVFAGVEFAIGSNSLDYSNATTPRVPEENRFTKQVLDFNLDEPMEMDELVDRGIIYVERRGAIKIYEYETEQVKVLDSIDVFYKNEDGLLGLAVDPNFDQNKWLYFFYSPNIERAVQYVSRFELKDDRLIDEKILLEIPVIRQCCHSGGSLEFDDDGLLYIGIGDNTNPFESSGYAPIDERQNRQLYDAQRSAGNTNDLRGKILRVKPEADGTYSIPKGNLFAEGTLNCRPEIFVMGCRNPFRFSIDSKTKDVYWGDVGPDAGVPDSLRGPSGMGEFNQAKKAGFYGWPYSRGNNQMYGDYDFENEKSGPLFDPKRIINNSPNNTGIQELPPIQESMIWFSYKASKEFPWLGSGGVNPMSGPIYHSDGYPQSDYSLPSYFDNKWFVYEWMRDWIYVIHLDENQQYIQADPFMPATEFSHPMDMLVAKDGKLYVLEYGQKWNTRNLDARLSLINYNAGNRPPTAKVHVDKEVGAAPLTVGFSATESMDYDQDQLSYQWKVNEEQLVSDSPELKHRFEKPGIYDVQLLVTDPSGSTTSTNKKIMVGNERPNIKIQLSDPNTTYWKHKTVDYTVSVSDLEDGNSEDASLDLSKVKVTLNYIPEGEDMILASIGHQQNVVPKGLELINGSDCKACHAADAKVAGPSYKEIAAKYDKSDKKEIMRRIIVGSQGIWGENMMAAHPQLAIDDVSEMVEYILSLDPGKKNEEHNFPLKGSLVFDKHKHDNEAGKYVLMASYLDEGHPEIEGSELSSVEQVIFKAPRFEMESATDLGEELSVWNSQGKTVVGSIKDGTYIKFDPISFKGLKSVRIGAAFNKDYQYAGEAEIRVGNPDGQLLGKTNVSYFNKDKAGYKTMDIALKSSTEFDSLYLVFKNGEDKDRYVMNGDWLQLYYN